MMAKEYKDRGPKICATSRGRALADIHGIDAGGEYNTDPKEKDDSQKNLTNWGEEEWCVVRSPSLD